MKKNLSEQVLRILEMMGIDEQENCGGVLQAAMLNPNDPKNAAILSGSKTNIDANVNRDNGFGNKYNMMSKEDQELLRKQNIEDDKNNKEIKRQQELTWNNKFNPYLNLQNEKISREDKVNFNNGYNNFIKNNPTFSTEQSKYNPIQRYSFINKSTMDQWLVRKLNVLFNNSSPWDNIRVSTDQLNKYIEDPKIGGFDKFLVLYKSNFPNVVYPDNPHKFD